MSANLLIEVFRKVMERRVAVSGEANVRMHDCLTPKCEFFILGNTNYSNRTSAKKTSIEQDVLGRAMETKIFIKNQALTVLFQQRQVV